VTRDELRATLLGLLGELAPEADLAALAPRAELRDTLDLDSMDFLRFVQGIADALGVEVPESDYAKLATLEDCIGYLAEQHAGG
jgi:acyl carrier protein